MSETKNNDTYRRAETMFVPLQRPLLQQVPDAAMARAFLQEVDRYQNEVKVRMKLGEGSDQKADPLWFFLETYLLNYLRQSEDTFPEDRDVDVDDEVIRSWLQSVAKVDDGRSLGEIFTEVVWPRTGGTSSIRRYNNKASTIGGADKVVIQGVITLERAAQIFRMEVIRVLDDHQVLERFTEKRVIKELATKCPAPIRSAIREHFGLKIGEEAKKSLSKFWKLVLSTTKMHDETRRHVAGISFSRGEGRAAMNVDFAYQLYPEGGHRGGRPSRDTRGGVAQKGGGHRAGANRGTYRDTRGRANRVPLRSFVAGNNGSGNFGSRNSTGGSTGATAAGAASTGSSAAGAAVAGVTCYGCGKTGHYSRNCPEKSSGSGGSTRGRDDVSTTRSGRAYKKPEGARSTREVVGPSESPVATPVTASGDEQANSTPQLNQVWVGDSQVGCREDSGADRTILPVTVWNQLRSAGETLAASPCPAKTFELGDGREVVSTMTVQLRLGFDSDYAPRKLWLNDVTAYVMGGMGELVLLGKPELNALGVPTAKEVIDGLVNSGVLEVQAGARTNDDAPSAVAAMMACNSGKHQQEVDLDAEGYTAFDNADGIRLAKWNPGMQEKRAELAGKISQMLEKARTQGASAGFVEKVVAELDGVDIWRCELGWDPPADVEPMVIVLKDGATLPKRLPARRFSPPAKRIYQRACEGAAPRWSNQ